MIQYNKSTIYKLCCKDANITDIYIGSTTNFRLRKSQHKSICNNENSKKYNFKVYKFIRENGGFENWDMVEIEKINAADKKDLHKNERRVIDELRPLLNCYIPCRTKKEYVIINADKIKEYRAENADKIKEYHKEYRAENANKIKEYYAENADKINEQGKEKINCKCGSTITKYNLSHHIKTKKHIQYIKSLENIPYGSNFIFVD